MIPHRDRRNGWGHKQGVAEDTRLFARIPEILEQPPEALLLKTLLLHVQDDPRGTEVGEKHGSISHSASGFAGLSVWKFFLI